MKTTGVGIKFCTNYPDLYFTSVLDCVIKFSVFMMIIESRRDSLDIALSIPHSCRCPDCNINTKCTASLGHGVAMNLGTRNHPLTVDPAVPVAARPKKVISLVQVL